IELKQSACFSPLRVRHTKNIMRWKIPRVIGCEEATEKGGNRRGGDKVADLEDRSRRDNLRILGIPENPETANPLVYLLDAIPKWFPEMGSIEIMRAHRVGPAKEDANHKPIPRPVLLKLLRFTDRDKILGAARKTMVKLDGSPVRFVPDYSTRTFRRRLAFSNAIGALQKLGFHTFLLYPAKLKVMRGGTTHIFDTPQMAEKFANSMKE
uniref:L1 transposable element RRM domain-containing protein n=1 Tax=Kryptolebias marmoratus TaxID=37003 RepID=A0A3Q3ACD4_KRYMA